MSKALRQTFPTVLLFAGFLTKLRDSFRFEVPVGYQDETGFHLGKEPKRDNISWPPVS